LRNEFSKFGHIKNIVLKHAYAFIDFEDHEAASRAVKEMNGKTFVNGEELVVE
jgi:RNA recognition motif-containing protein